MKQATNARHPTAPEAENARATPRERESEPYVTASEREFAEAFVERATFIEPTEEIRACRDGKDDKFLELALTGRAECIISGDNDLISLSPFRSIAIMTAAEFLVVTTGDS